MGLKIKISCIAHCKNCTWCIWIINKQSFFLYLIIGPRLWGIINRVSSKECPLPGQIFIKLLYTIKTAFTFLSQIITAVSLTSVHEKVMVKKNHISTFILYSIFFYRIHCKWWLLTLWIYSMLSLTYTLFFFKKSILNLVSKFPCKWEQCRPHEKFHELLSNQICEVCLKIVKMSQKWPYHFIKWPRLPKNKQHHNPNN